MKPGEICRPGWSPTSRSTVGWHEGRPAAAASRSGTSPVGRSSTCCGASAATCPRATTSTCARWSATSAGTWRSARRGDVRDTKWRWSLMNWGHDPLKGPLPPPGGPSRRALERHGTPPKERRRTGTVSSDPAAAPRTAVSGRRRSSRGRRRPRPPAAPTAGRRRPSPRRTSASSGSRSPGATSKTSSSCTCSSIRERSPASRSARVDAQHGDLDDVGRRALDRGVERHPLGHLAALPVVADQVGQVAAAAEDGLGVAVVAGLGDDLRAGSRGRRRSRRSTPPSARAPPRR